MSTSLSRRTPMSTNTSFVAVFGVYRFYTWFYDSMSYSLNSLNGVIEGIMWGRIMGVIQGGY